MSIVVTNVLCASYVKQLPLHKKKGCEGSLVIS